MYDTGGHFNRSIESFGLCGAGKTTLLTQLLATVSGLGDDARPAVETPVQPRATASVLETGRIVGAALFAAPAAVGRFLVRKENWWLPQKLGYRVAGARMRNSLGMPLLVDSGILQPFVSFDIEWNLGNSEVPTEPLLNALTLPALALYVKTPPEVAYERYVSREQRAGRALPAGNLRSRFDKGYEMCEELKRACLRAGRSVEVVDATRIDASEEVARIAQRVLSHVANARA